MANAIAVGGWIVLSIMCFVIYHKLFHVVYFSGQAFTHELIGCLVAGGGLLYLIVKYWWVALIVLFLFIASFHSNEEE